MTVISHDHDDMTRVVSKPGPHKSCDMHVMVRGPGRGEWISACMFNDRVYENAAQLATTFALGIRKDGRDQAFKEKLV